MFVFAAHLHTASPGGKLSSVARLKRNAGGNVSEVPKFVLFPVLDMGIGTQFVLCRSASPEFLFRPRVRSATFSPGEGVLRRSKLPDKFQSIGVRCSLGE